MVSRSIRMVSILGRFVVTPFDISSFTLGEFRFKWYAAPHPPVNEPDFLPRILRLAAVGRMVRRGWTPPRAQPLAIRARLSIGQVVDPGHPAYNNRGERRVESRNREGAFMYERGAPLPVRTF